MEDEDAILGPNGLPLVDAELEVLRGEYSQWQEQNAGEDMPLADYAAKFFFADCSTVATASDDDDNNAAQDSLYPDLSQDATPSVFSDLNSSDEPRRQLDESLTFGDTASGLGVGFRTIANSGTQNISHGDLVHWEVPSAGTERTKVDGSQAMADSAFSKNSLPARQSVLPVLNKAAVGKLPVLTRAAAASAHSASLDEVVTHVSNPVKGKLPALERIQTAAEMPAFEPIAAVMGMPALESIPKAVSARIDSANLPELEPIAGATSARIGGAHLPTLERATSFSDGLAMSAFNIGATMESVRGHGMDAMFRPRRAASNPTSFRSMLAEQDVNAYDSLFDDDTPLDTVARASLAHNFGVIRDQFASDSAALASAVSSSRGELMSFAADLRSALAGVEASDVDRVRATCGAHLSSNALTRVANSAESDASRASFVASAHALADAIVAHHSNDAEVRSILVGIKKPDIFVSTLYEAWKRLVNQAIKDMRGIKTPNAAYNAMSAVFAPIRRGVVIVERKKPDLTRGRMIVWGYIAGTIIKMSIANMVALPTGTVVWSRDLWARMYHDFKGVSEALLEPEPEPIDEDAHVIGDKRILVQTTIAKKVLRGLQIVAKDALAGIGDDTRKELAVRGTEAFMARYLQKKPSEVGLYLSAVAGIELMHKVAEVRGYDDVYDAVVIRQLVEANGIAAADTDPVEEV
jgi:hypothetical protein